DDEAPSSGGGGGGGNPRLGVGLILGSPTALTGKLFLVPSSAIQLHIGYSFRRYERFILILDYLFHFVGVIPPASHAGRFLPDLRGGARFAIRSDEDALLGVRFPLGLSFLIAHTPIEVFVEVAIGIGIIPETVATFDGGIGGRFYF